MANPSHLALLFIAALLGGCTTVHRDNWVPSPNFNERRPNYVIIHQTDSINHARALDTLTNPVKQVSAHYLIAKDGRVTQMVEEKDRAWHAGKSYWGGQTDMNSVSIGIELDHMGDAPFESSQIDALLVLLKGISERHRIPAANYLAHGDVALGRKVDPNYLFPWQKLAENNFGIWCNAEDVGNLSNPIDPLLGLQALGYDVGQPESAALAFLRHFRGRINNAQFNDDDLRVLNCLLKKKSQPPENHVDNDAPRGTINAQ